MYYLQMLQDFSKKDNRVLSVLWALQTMGDISCNNKMTAESLSLSVFYWK
jgi:hypothetical protein